MMVLIGVGRKEGQAKLTDCREPAHGSCHYSNISKLEGGGPTPAIPGGRRGRRRRVARILSTAATAVGFVAGAAGDHPTGMAAATSTAQTAHSSLKEKAVPTTAAK